MFAVVALLAGVGACGPDKNKKDDDDNGGKDAGVMDASTQDGATEDAESDAVAFQAFHNDCTITTGPAGSAEETTKNLERAFVESGEGDVICLVDGKYDVKRELALTENGITLRGESQKGTVLDFDAQKEGANGIVVNAAKNFAAINFTIKNTASDSLKTKGTDGVVMKNITVTWDRGKSVKNGAYALYPVESKNVLIEGCEVSYARDAGVYLGQSDTAIIRDNEAYGNVIGIEIENTYRAEAYNNHAHGNTDGFLVINLPDLQVKGGGENLVYDNKIEDNNIDNFGKQGTAVAKMPPGSGMIVLASNNNEIRDNTIKNNKSLGMAVVSYHLIDAGGSDDMKYDPYPEGNWLHDNTLENNGNDPTGAAQIASRMDGTAPQVTWDGRFDTNKDNSDGSKTNCFENNKTPGGMNLGVERISATDECPSMMGGMGAEYCKNDCSHDKVERVDLPQRVLDMAK